MRHTISFFITLLLFVHTITSCNTKIETSNTDLEEAKKAIASSNAIYFQAFVKNDSSIFINRYAEDACILAPFAPATCGRNNAVRFFRQAYDQYGLRNGKFITTAVYGTGDGYIAEESLWQSFNAKGELFDDGKFLVLWKKQKKDGKCSGIHLAATGKTKGEHPYSRSHPHNH